MKKVIHPISLSFSFQDTIPSGNGYIMLDREFVNWPLFYDDAAAEPPLTEKLKIKAKGKGSEMERRKEKHVEGF